MNQSVKCLLHKDKDLSLDPSHIHCQVLWYVPVIPALEREGQRDLWGI